MISRSVIPVLLLLLGVIVAGCGDDSTNEGGHERRVAEALANDPASRRWIKDDWERAQKEAEEKGRPIFALFRCVP